MPIKLFLIFLNSYYIDETGLHFKQILTKSVKKQILSVRKDWNQKCPYKIAGTASSGSQVYPDG